MIWLAYLSIPAVLVSFVRRRRDIPFSWMFWMFGAFIVSCGFTHFMEVITFYTPLYRLSGLVKLVTAVVSWATVIGLIPLIPKALALRSPRELEREITERKRIEHELQRARDELEERVKDRTAALTEANAALQKEISERKQAEERLAEADRQKNDFLAMLGHELRNPLAPIRNALHVIKMPGANDPRVRQARDMMERQLQHLVRLVDDLLDVSRIIRGKIELRKQPVDLAAAVARGIETAQPVMDAQGHELSVSLPGEPIWVEADLIRLAQVIANLLTNAAKYTEKAGRIWLNAEREDRQAVLRIRDTGIGIARELLPRIFDLFVQGDHSLARSQGGLGIGLTVVKRLTEMHEGTVTVSSAGVGQGSEFVLRLPALSDGQGYADQAAPTTRPHVTDALRKRVLIVDDNVDAAESIAMILSMSGYEVRCAHDGPSVLQAAKAYRPDVVVLDIGLPGMSGYEVARQLREQPEFKRITLLAVTGYGQEDDRRRSQEAGFDYHLTKPVDPGALQAFVARPYSFR